MGSRKGSGDLQVLQVAARVHPQLFHVRHVGAPMLDVVRRVDEAGEEPVPMPQSRRLGASAFRVARPLAATGAMRIFEVRSAAAVSETNSSELSMGVSYIQAR